MVSTTVRKNQQVSLHRTSYLVGKIEMAQFSNVIWSRSTVYPNPGRVLTINRDMVSSSKKKKKKSSGKKKHASKNYTIKDRRLHKAGFVNISQGSKGCVKCCWCAYYKQYNLEKHFRYDTIESHAQTKHKELLKKLEKRMQNVVDVSTNTKNQSHLRFLSL